MPLTPILAALADPTRLEAMRILHDGGEHCVCELMERLGASQSRMSRHMGTLKAAGLAVDRRDAQWVRYRLNPDLTPELRAMLDAVMAAAKAAPSIEERNAA
ncbi:ArsR/SmtB family transcription factor [Rubrimonas sp.]|uniref:ArsR/SmtB family transcription factor n=1 Tax=Rubrimonas sp. TaxID=2036015 RepID=UPI002FDC80C5